MMLRGVHLFTLAYISPTLAVASGLKVNTSTVQQDGTTRLEFGAFLESVEPVSKSFAIA